MNFIKKWDVNKTINSKVNVNSLEGEVEENKELEEDKELDEDVYKDIVVYLNGNQINPLDLSGIYNSF